MCERACPLRPNSGTLVKGAMPLLSITRLNVIRPASLSGPNNPL